MKTTFIQTKRKKEQLIEPNGKKKTIFIGKNNLRSSKKNILKNEKKVNFKKKCKTIFKKKVKPPIFNEYGAHNPYIAEYINTGSNFNHPIIR